MEKQFNLSEKIYETEDGWRMKIKDVAEFIRRSLDIVLDIKKTPIRKAGEIKRLAGAKFK